MPPRLPLLLLALAPALPAQYGTTPKPSAQDYPAHTTIEKLSLGAEYLVHSFSSGRDMFIAKDYLVVEVALFPPAGQALVADPSHFSLRVNNRKQALAPESPEIVASTLKYPDQRFGPHSVAQVGPVIFGQPQPTERFPGDPNARTGPPRPVPDDNLGGLDKQPPVTATELAVQAALPAGEHHGPTSGYLYFPYRGKVGHIRSLELVFAGPAGGATLQLLDPAAYHQ